MPENVVEITKWYRIKKDEEGNIIGKSFNHYSEGWVEGMYPQPFDQSFTNQVAWQKEDWTKEYTYITTEKRIV